MYLKKLSYTAERDMYENIYWSLVCDFKKLETELPDSSVGKSSFPDCSVGKKLETEFPGGPVVRTLHFHCQGLGSIPGWGTKILQALKHNQKQKARSPKQPEGHIAKHQDLTKPIDA